MATIGKDAFLALWDKWQRNPNDLNITDRKVLVDSAIELSKSGEIDSDFAQKVMSEVNL